jgi:hypothetical protein
MVVRIRFATGQKIGNQRRKNRRLASAVAALLTLPAVMALALAIWRIAADLGWTSSFAIPDGPFSHWQVWMGAAAAFQLCAHVLNRYAKDGGAAVS